MLTELNVFKYSISYVLRNRHLILTLPVPISDSLDFIKSIELEKKRKYRFPNKIFIKFHL